MRIVKIKIHVCNYPANNKDCPDAVNWKYKEEKSDDDFSCIYMGYNGEYITCNHPNPKEVK